jgi:hypothetical protein
MCLDDLILGLFVWSRSAWVGLISERREFLSDVGGTGGHVGLWGMKGSTSHTLSLPSSPLQVEGNDCVANRAPALLLKARTSIALYWIRIALAT